MSNGLWPSTVQAGLAANRPTAPSETPAGTFIQYLATDTGVLSIWNPNTNAWTVGSVPQVLAAAGQTQGTATQILGTRAIVTVLATATHNGVKLPAVSTGLEVVVVNGTATGGIKVYPITGNKIAANATNAADATNLASFKVNRYVGVNKLLWAVDRGA